MEKLRITIDGDWKAADFAAFFKELDTIFRYISFRYTIVAFDNSSESPERLVQMRSRFGPLRVEKIQYGSPGFTDLVGLGAAIRELREFIQFLIIHFREKRSRELSNEQRQIELTNAKLELLLKLRKIRSEGALTDKDQALSNIAENIDFSDLPDFAEIASAILEGRLISAENFDSEKPNAQP
jgi:hypothetical protein